MGKKRRELARAEAQTAERHEFDVGGMLGHGTTYTVNVSERTALGIDVVYACVRVIADAVADARWGEWKGDERLDDSRLVRRPDGRRTRRDWSWQMAATLCLYNVAAVEREGTATDGGAMNLALLRPGQLTRSGDHWVIDGNRTVPDDRIRVLRRAIWPSVTEELGTVLKLARSTFAAAWAADAYRADFWQNGGAPQIVLTTDQKLSSDDADSVRDRWVAKRQESPGAPAVLGLGVEAKPLGADLAGADGGGSADRMGQAAARYFGMPAWLVNVASAAGSLTYSNTEQAGLDLVRYTLRGYLGPIEDMLSEELPGDYLTGRRVALDVSHLTVGTLLERFQAYDIATQHRAWMTPAEVRKELHLPPDAALDDQGAPAPAMESIPAEGAL